MGKLYRIILVLSILASTAARSQTMSCEQTLAFATDEFNAGHFYAVPSILSECLLQFNRDQRQRAHLLLTQTYLLLDDPIGAERSYLEVLSADPEFVPDPQLHAIDIVYLSKRYTATPRFSWFMGGGSNVSPVRVILENGIAEENKEAYSMRPGYHFGGGAEYSYDDHLRLRLETNFVQTSFKAQPTFFEVDTRSFVERQTWINIPLYLCYSDNRGRYRPYVFGGYSLSYLILDKASIVLEAVPENIGGENQSASFEVSSPDFDFLYRRNRLNQSVIFGGGVRYKTGLDFVFAEIRYSAGLKNIVNPAHSYGDSRLDPTSNQSIASATPQTQFSHLDDYFRLDNIALTIGFVRPLYKPRKLARVRTKGVLRKMKGAQ